METNTIIPQVPADNLLPGDGDVAAALVKQKSRRRRELLDSLPWISPALILIFAIVLFPAGYMLYNSTRAVSRTGKDKGFAGFENYLAIFQMPYLPRVFLNTIIWVVVVVGLTLVISLFLANFLHKEFPGRQVVRLIVIIPWASSVVMTTTVVYYSLEPNYGLLNQFLYDLGVLSSPDYGFTKNPLSAFIAAIVVAIFVSLPFTTYTLLAGLSGIPKDILEAARVDGAGPVRTYFSIVFPQLKPALAVAAMINIINVFNSLPILKLMTGSVPGYDADTTTTLTFKLIQTDLAIDKASALSVLNLIIVIVVIALYVKITKPMKGIDE